MPVSASAATATAASAENGRSQSPRSPGAERTAIAAAQTSPPTQTPAAAWWSALGRKEPGRAADATGGVAGQRPGEAEDEGEPEEEDSPREGSGRGAKRVGGRRRGDGDRRCERARRCPRSTRGRSPTGQPEPSASAAASATSVAAWAAAASSGAGPGQRQGANEGAVGASRESGAEHHECERRPAERHGLAHEAGRAEPYQRQRDHGSATVARRRRPSRLTPSPGRLTVPAGGPPHDDQVPLQDPRRADRLDGSRGRPRPRSPGSTRTGATSS